MTAQPTEQATSILQLNAPQQTVDVVVLIVAYNGRNYLPDCLGSLRNTADPSIRVQVVLVDNASGDSSAAYVQENFPEVDCLPLSENLGFAGGNEAGWQHTQLHYPQANYLCLLNQDTVVTKDWLPPLIAHLEQYEEVACVQPLLALHPETERVNTLGNRSHYLGFGFTTYYRHPCNQVPQTPRAIDFASGAACLLRTSALKDQQLFDPFLFMYLEDAELGWRMRQRGCEIHVVPQSVVQHKYRFNRDFRFYFHLERNRWWLLLCFYKWPTLLLLAPALLLMELGQCCFALKIGRFRDKLRSYAFFWKPAHVRRLFRRRHELQRQRTICDRSFMNNFTGNIETPELSNPLITWIANPLLNTYWKVVRHLIWW